MTLLAPRRKRRDLGDERADGASTSRLGGGASLWPLAVLFGFNFVDELDSAVFSALAPEIRSSFDLSDAGFTAIASLASALALVCSLPIGHLADRRDRLHLARLAAGVWATASVVAAGAWHVAALAVARLTNGVGRTANLPLHSGLLADWYPRASHGGVLATYTGASYAAALAGPVAGFAGSHLGWRAALALSALPTVAVVAASARLREPLRGQQDDPVLAAEAASRPASDRATFAESRRRIFAVPTLRRLLVVAYVAGLGVFPLSTFLSFHFERTFGAGPTLRGFVQVASGGGAALGLVVGAVLLQRWTRTRGEEAAVEVMAGGIGLFATGAVAVGWSPNAPVALLATAVLGASSGCFYPALQTVVAAVAPPAARSQAFAWALFVAAAGGLSSFTISGIGQSVGYPVALTVLGVIGACAAGTAWTIRGAVTGDVEAAASALAVTAEARHQAAVEGALLRIADLGVSFDGHTVLDGVDLAVRAGEVVALLGTNGAGKSTLIAAVMGHVAPQEGTVLFDGRDVTHADPRQLARLGAAHVPGGASSLPDLTVDEHLRLAGWLTRDRPAEAARRIGDALARLPTLAALRQRRAGDLSGGEQHQLAIAMALVQAPRLLLLDELGLGLSATALDEVCALIEHLRSEGCGILVVDQSVELSMRVASRAVFLERGVVRFDGPLAELRADTDLIRSVFLAGSAATSRGARTARAAGVDEEHRLEVRAVSCELSGNPILRGVDLAVGPGEVVALRGGNGAGKTTLLDVVTGFVPASAGAVIIDGVDVSDWPAPRRVLHGLARTLQEARLAPTLTVADAIMLGFERDLPFPSLSADLLRLRQTRWQEAHVRLQVEDLLDALGLRAWRAHPLGEISTGTRRLVQLGIAVAQRPAVLLLDEPSSGLAAAEVPALAGALRRVIEDLSCATVLVEHDITLVDAVADRQVLLEHGVARVL